MKTVLVTGASGALGNAVVALLRAEGSPASADWRVLTAGRAASGADSVAMDIRDRAHVLEVINATRPDLVLHLAATLSDDFDEAFAINVDGARNMLDAVLASGHAARVLLAGSAAEYGVVLPDENPVPVSHPLKPVSTYGLTKAWQSMLAGLYADKGIELVIARIFNLDGPGLSTRLFAGRVRQQIDAIKAGTQSRLKVGPIAAVRDYVSLDIAAQQIVAIAMHGNAGSTYHVGSGTGISMRDLLRIRLKEEGLDFSLVDEDPGNSNRKGYDVPVIYADMTDTWALMANTDMQAR